MDFEFIREQTPLYIEAAKLTLHMAVIGVLLAIVVGLVCSMIKYFRIPVLRQIVECYIELSRNTPLLIQLFFLYFYDKCLCFPRLQKSGFGKSH